MVDNQDQIILVEVVLADMEDLEVDAMQEMKGEVEEGMIEEAAEIVTAVAVDGKCKT